MAGVSNGFAWRWRGGGGWRGAVGVGLAPDFGALAELGIVGGDEESGNEIGSRSGGRLTFPIGRRAEPSTDPVSFCHLFFV